MNLYRYTWRRLTVLLILVLVFLTGCQGETVDNHIATSGKKPEIQTTPMDEEITVEDESDKETEEDDIGSEETTENTEIETEVTVMVNKTMYTRKKLSVYEEKDTNSKVVATVYSYCEVYVISHDSKWSNIKYDGKEGYIKSVDFLESRNAYKADGFKQAAKIDNYIRDLDTKKPMIALTFDDGPSSYTEKILDALEANNQRATFFVIGKEIKGREATVQRAYKLGCQIGVHTYSHPKLTLITVEDETWQINTTVELIKKLIPMDSLALRPPYGAYNDEMRDRIEMPFILWSVDTKDWETKDVESTYSIVTNGASDGKIYLMHDIYAATAEAAVRIINDLTNKGYQLVTVDEMAYYKGVTLKNGKVYKTFK
ncbi:MAG: hypothetical protein E7266_06555 [Lachnospiraceae bacterium]|nr:hypothetical protein [Lachnospiraceae bacterium]